MPATRYGRLAQEYTTNFEHGTVPSWCALREDGPYAGALVAPPTVPGGGLDLTATGPGRGVGVRLARGVDLTTVKVVELEAIIFGGGDATTAIFLGLRNLDGTRGAGLVRNANNSSVFLRSMNPAQVNIDTTFRSLGGALRHSIGFRLLPNEIRDGVAVRIAHLLIDGETFSERTFTAAELPLDTIVTPELTIGAASSAVGATTRTLHRFEYREYLR